MSFWQSDLGEISGNSAEAFVKSFRRIPDGTMALAKIDNFINAEYKGLAYLSIDWVLTEGDFKGQKVNQKLKVFDYDPKVKHRALNMFKLLYQLFNSKPQSANAPSDNELKFFIGKEAGIKIRETEPNDEGKQYNWVSEVHKSQGFKCETGVSVEIVHKRNDMTSAFDRNPKVDILESEDIPF
ncbi:MAG TPA: hypothetical protein VGO21_01620 [Candidatus Paceibacterota bacterium]|jgi:hypothetical protein|nr:hypothetical protein [Candidatus Paceibacterota bacterium]